MAGQHRREEPERTWHEFPELPPRPDPQSGEPWPDPGLAYTGSEGSTSRSSPASSRIFGKPKPPPGLGPPLAWYYDDIPGQIVGYLVAFVIMVVGAGIVSLLNDFGLHGLEYWQIWLVIIISSYLMSSPLDAKMMAAGADWLQWGRRKRWYQRYPRTGFIQTYDLIRITADSSGVNAPYLYLEDSESNRLYRMRHDLQKDRRIWDLLYNGILHSVANGAEINAMSIELLELDRTPALSLRDRGRPTDEKA